MPLCMACHASTDEPGRFCPACGAVRATVASSANAAPSLIGSTVDGFAIESVLGGGSFGTVFRARQVGLDRIVALKVPTHEIAADPVMARRFAREARAASRVHHPGVVAIHAVGELPDGRPYLAMQLVDGEPLDRILEGGPVPPIRALELARQIASALSETHVAGVVHRDLKPSNIVWRTDRNGDDLLTLVDFGIAVCKPGTADATRLTSGGLIGTPHYMSPEQAHGEQVDARADLYALGCIAFELLTGATPFDGSGFEVLLAHLGRPAPRPSERRPEIPELVDRLVVALLAKRPDDRPQTADQVVAMIDGVLDELDAEQPPSEAADAPRSRRRTRPTGAQTTRERPPVPPLPPPDPEPPEDEPALDASGPTRAVPARRSPGARLRDVSLGAAGALLVVVAGFAAVRLTREAPPTEEAPAAAQAQQRREIFRDDGQTRLRVFVPDPLRARPTGQRIHLELRNKLGQRIVAEQVIVTMEAPDGKTAGVIARPRQSNPDQFSLFYELSRPGTYRMRIFPPETTSSFEIELDVEP
ncbi:MAG: protein kinase domain-containing protein [Kofleriaceae bacterium]